MYLDNISNFFANSQIHNISIEGYSEINHVAIKKLVFFCWRYSQV